MQTLILGCSGFICLFQTNLVLFIYYFPYCFATLKKKKRPKNFRTSHSALNSCTGGVSRATGMLLHYKPPGSQDSQQLRMEAADDKKSAASWLAAMHKVGKVWIMK